MIHTRVRAAQANAYAERFVRTIGAECLDWLLIVGRRHLDHVLRTYTTHGPERGATRRCPARSALTLPREMWLLSTFLSCSWRLG